MRHRHCWFWVVLAPTGGSDGTKEAPLVGAGLGLLGAPVYTGGLERHRLVGAGSASWWGHPGVAGKAPRVGAGPGGLCG